ncbi:mucin-2-like [Physella acuta]|uniref:mucin-2-like n=1 Tax=Physella acuta TaxID=109671 RepID=UPI0027DC7B0A|nr:mucin-2-like [Physella acuta]
MKTLVALLFLLSSVLQLQWSAGQSDGPALVLTFQNYTVNFTPESLLQFYECLQNYNHCESSSDVFLVISKTKTNFTTTIISTEGFEPRRANKTCTFSVYVSPKFYNFYNYINITCRPPADTCDHQSRLTLASSHVTPVFLTWNRTQAISISDYDTNLIEIRDCRASVLDFTTVIPPTEYLRAGSFASTESSTVKSTRTVVDTVSDPGGVTTNPGPDISSPGLTSTSDMQPTTHVIVDLHNGTTLPEGVTWESISSTASFRTDGSTSAPITTDVTSAVLTTASTSAPDVSHTELTTASTSAPDVSHTELTTASTSVPDVSHTELTTASTSAPDVSHTELTTASTSAPDVSHTELTTASTSAPDVSHTELTTASTSAPDVSHTELTTASTSAPDVSHTELTTASTSAPDVSHTELTTASTSAPDVSHTELTTASTSVPDVSHTELTTASTSAPAATYVSSAGVTTASTSTTWLLSKLPYDPATTKLPPTTITTTSTTTSRSITTTIATTSAITTATTPTSTTTSTTATTSSPPTTITLAPTTTTTPTTPATTTTTTPTPPTTTTPTPPTSTSTPTLTTTPTSPKIQIPETTTNPNTNTSTQSSSPHTTTNSPLTPEHPTPQLNSSHPTLTTQPSTENNTTKSENTLNTSSKIIIAACVVIFLLLATIVLAVIFLARRRRRKNKNSTSPYNTTRYSETTLQSTLASRNSGNLRLQNGNYVTGDRDLIDLEQIYLPLGSKKNFPNRTSEFEPDIQTSEFEPDMDATDAFYMAAQTLRLKIQTRPSDYLFSFNPNPNDSVATADTHDTQDTGQSSKSWISAFLEDVKQTFRRNSKTSQDGTEQATPRKPNPGTTSGKQSLTRSHVFDFLGTGSFTPPAATSSVKSYSTSMTDNDASSINDNVIRIKFNADVNQQSEARNSFLADVYTKLGAIVRGIKGPTTTRLDLTTGSYTSTLVSDDINQSTADDSVYSFAQELDTSTADLIYESSQT